MTIDLNKVLSAREKTQKIVHTVASQIELGMSEEDGHELLDRTLKQFEVQKKWHPSKFRIGKNTTKSFREISEPQVTLGQNDLFFIDIGPVFDGYEGDYGETFQVGNDPSHLHLVESVKDIFKETSLCWKEQNLTGAKLYQFAEQLAHKKGLKLNTSMSGHYLAEFPHALITKADLIDIEETIEPNVWVLEIMVRDDKNQRGAFYEDLLLKD